MKNDINNKNPIRILIAEDLPTDAELAERTLEREGFVFTSQRVDTRENFLEALENFSPDIVISDYSMPVFDGMTALKLARVKDPLIPFIVLTGSMNEDTAVQCMKAGASDYVIKEHITRLPFAVTDALERRKHQENMMIQENRIRESELRYRTMFHESHAVMLIIDSGDGSLFDVNQAACEYYGWCQEKMLSLNIRDIDIHGKEHPCIPSAQFSASDSGAEHDAGDTGRKSFRSRHRRADGSERDVESSCGVITLEERRCLFLIIHDITERIKAERERDENASRLSHYLKTSPTVTYALLLEDGKVSMLWISENIQSLLGYTPEEALKENWWFDNLHPGERTRVLSGISKLTPGKTVVQEYRFRRRDRSIVWLRNEMRLTGPLGKGFEIVATHTDISLQKQAEAELSLKSSALEAAANAIIITDHEGTIQWINPAFEVLTGYTKEEIVGKNPRDLVSSGEQPREFYSTMWDLIISGKSWHGELMNRRKNGELYFEKMTITPVPDETGRITHFIAIKSDISEEVRSKEKLEFLLQEKEVLLKELHHRIKNNMQMIISLLRLSSDTVHDESALKVLGDIGRRLMSMSIVHDLFYHSSDFSSLDFGVYLNKISDEIRAEHIRYGTQFRIQCGTELIKLDLEKAVSAGLVVAEILEDLFRSAEAEEQVLKEIELKLVQQGGLLIISLSPYPASLIGNDSPEGKESISLVLVHTLVEQLRGSLNVRTGGGDTLVFSFPEK